MHVCPRFKLEWWLRCRQRRWPARRSLDLLAAALLVTAGPSLQAAPSPPWSPTATVRHDIELLVDDAGLDLTVSQWPLPHAAVADALARLPSRLSPPLAAARDRVRRALEQARTSRASLTLQGKDEALAGFGDDATRGSSIALRSSPLETRLVAAQVGIRIESSSGPAADTKLRLDDSALAVELEGLQLQAFSHRNWWGPGWQSSLVLGNNAPAFNGVGMQRAAAGRSESPWLAWLGPWNFEMFVAQTEDVSNPANPYFVGQRFTFKPFPNLEIGLTRTAQWGGRGRHQTAKSFFRMLTGRGVNADTVGEQPDDPANEMAGFDVRLRCPGSLPCAGYVQAIGEDQAGWLPSRYLGLYGIETWSTDGADRFYAEFAETGCRGPIGQTFIRDCAYRNYAYPGGYTNAGRWMGASVGPDSRLLTLGWLDALRGTSVRLNAGSVGSRIGSFTPQVIDPTTSGRLLGVAARQPFQWGAVTVTPGLDWVHIATPTGRLDDARIGVNLQMGLDAGYEQASGALGASLSSAGASSLRPLWVGAGLVAASALLDRSADRYAENHLQNPSGRAVGRIGSAVPVGAFAFAGLTWVLQRDNAKGDVALAALEAGVSAAVVSEVVKRGVDRSRPLNGQGSGEFGGAGRNDSSFPSVHSAVAWAVLTPLAKENDAPWLYGVAALSNIGRVADRQHWLSDTVAGAVLGYFAGDWFYRRTESPADPSGVKVWLSPSAVHMEKRFD